MSIQKTIDEKWMRAALSLSRRTKGTTWPNPHVGCIIIKDNHVVGRGWTAKSGKPHAETQALIRAGDKAVESTVYVTLEPCAHIAKTQSCTLSLIEAKVGRIVVSTRDLDPRVAGKGISLLKNAGISVTEGILEKESCYEHSGFFNRIVTGKPRIILKLASSLDGQIADKNNQSKWITSLKSRTLTHFYRMRSDAIMVGSGTAAADNPSLDVRHILTDHQPTRIIIDSKLKTSTKDKIFKSMNKIKTIICCLNNVENRLINKWESNGAKVIKCKGTVGGKVDLNDAMNHLGTLGFNNIFCEGGSKLATNLINENLINEFISITSGLLIGSNGKSLIGEFAEATLSKLPKLKLREAYQYGEDVVSVWKTEN